MSPNMDRNTTSQGQLSLNFTDFIVAPLMVALTNLVPGNALACEHMSAWLPARDWPGLRADRCRCRRQPSPLAVHGGRGLGEGHVHERRGPRKGATAPRGKGADVLADWRPAHCAQEHDKWRRRAKAFEDVVMPIAKALGGASTPLQGEELERRVRSRRLSLPLPLARALIRAVQSAAQSKRMRRKSLNTLRTFVRMSSPVAAGGTQSAPLEEQPP